MCRDNPGLDGSDEPGGAPSSFGELSLDGCLELLSNRHRRLILEYFMDTGQVDATVDEIVSHIIEDEAHRTGVRPGHDAVVTTLFHIHLPKFADASVLEYDTRHLEIRFHGDPRIEQVYSKIRDLE